MDRLWVLVLGLAVLSPFLQAEEEASLCPDACTCHAALQHVMCSNASLRVVPAGIAADTLELNLDYNNLTRLANGTFQSQAQLTGLHLSNCGLQSISAGAFEGLGGLAYLHLDGNLLEMLEEGTFQNLSSLLYLHLENNRITSLDSEIFQPLSKLSALYLSNNQLTELSEETLDSVPQLRWLYLDHNLLSNISDKAFAGTRLLRKLNLEANNLTSVPRALRKTSSLQSLWLSRNPVGRLSSSSFGRRMRSLTELYLDELGLKKVTSTTFPKMPRLRTLSLRNNQLETLMPHMLGAQTELLLGGNPWHCDCRLIMLHVHLQVMRVKGSQEEVLCSTPIDLKGQLLLNVALQQLTCPAFGTVVATTTPKNSLETVPTIKWTQPLIMDTQTAHTQTPMVSPQSKTTTKATIQHTTPSSNEIPAILDPCFADLINGVEAFPKEESWLVVSWSASGEQDQFEVRYSSGEAMQVVWATGHQVALELHPLHSGTDYKVCVIPLRKGRGGCTSPSAKQCATGHTTGMSEHVLPVPMPQHPDHSGLGTGLTVAIGLLVALVLVLVGAYKLRSRRSGFHRHFDEDGPGGELYNPDPYKVDTVHESTEEDRNIYVTAASQWLTEEEKPDCWPATPATDPITPRYINL